jgi:hypothetical protein
MRNVLRNVPQWAGDSRKGIYLLNQLTLQLYHSLEGEAHNFTTEITFNILKSTKTSGRLLCVFGKQKHKMKA